jgi:hypothetical protein
MCVYTLNFTAINRLYLSLNTENRQPLHHDAVHVRLVLLLQAGSTKLVRCPYLPLLLATTGHTPMLHPTLPNLNGI